ncbi:phosphatidate cytidylyltransferase [Parabacteroides sp. PF5-6]|uniref:phosphatidate cytidylyltransferase n=1 Tax=Parabacteroides sp. PF5-6 TaxID=1742403 RepID=UPI002407111E|nr:phosphatidate cytidylyltransferase [Parabacteroides sp. PF5-6]MDF9829556.1 phosphatidate cytidylyltransferase [Parabacteroides sp. PF5-6]
MLRNLIKRACTGIIFVAVIIGAIWLHSYSYLALFSLVVALLLWEFYGLVEQSEKAYLKHLLYSLGGVYLFCASFTYSHSLLSSMVFLPYILFLMGVLIAELYIKGANPIRNCSLAIFGQLYIAGSFSLLNFISAQPNTPGEISYVPIYVLAIFVFIWLNDTGAYLIGSLLGKHRLFERISPKKSWEGFWGGFIIALLSSLIFPQTLTGANGLIWLGFATVVVIAGTYGDLFESLMKRTLEVKDSGKILPGHGGMLDRFDSIIFAIPAAYIYIEIWMQL